MDPQRRRAVYARILAAADSRGAIRIGAVVILECRGVAWHGTDEPAQDLADLSDIQRWLEVLDQIEDVALGAAGRVQPAAAVVVDNEDLTRATAVFQRAFGAFA